jgi:hypothetical protein
MSDYCDKCGEKYIDTYKWCESCQLNNLKNNFTNWTSEDVKIDDFIQGMQLKSKPFNTIFEWIPYDQFSGIKEISKNSLAIIYEATWKDGPLIYDIDKKKLKRVPEKKIALKSLHSSRNIISEFTSEVCLISLLI